MSILEQERPQTPVNGVWMGTCEWGSNVAAARQQPYQLEVSEPRMRRTVETGYWQNQSLTLLSTFIPPSAAPPRHLPSFRFLFTYTMVLRQFGLACAGRLRKPQLRRSGENNCRPHEPDLDLVMSGPDSD